MRWGRYGFAVLVTVGVLGSGPGARAQSVPMGSASQTGLAGEFASLASRAALIFVGQVASIERHGGAVEIVFNVEQTVMGAPGAQYRLREWAGLWPQGQFRYTVGQRALVFLHGSVSSNNGKAAGFASPVDGAEGVVPVIVQGANAPELLDVRRLGTALLRAAGTPLATEATGAIQLTEALPLIAAGLPGAAANGLGRPEPVRLPMPVHLGISGALSGAGIKGTDDGSSTVQGGSAPVMTPILAPIKEGAAGSSRVSIEVERAVKGVFDGAR